MKYRPYVLLFLFTQLLVGQKVVKKSILNENISFIQIDANNCFEISMQTSYSDEVFVEAQIDGEYSNDLLLRIITEGPTLKIDTGFQPSFTDPNDKLSAHKVVSISLIIRLPKNKNVKVFGTSTNLMVAGDYKALNISLNDGICTLANVSKNTTVRTQSGDILVTTDRAILSINNKYGTTIKEHIPVGANY